MIRRSALILVPALAALLVGACSKTNDVDQSQHTVNNPCEESFQDCNGDKSDSCEVNTAVDTENCGACGVKCDSTHGEAACVDGVCHIQCDPGYGDCNQRLGDGCETDLDTTATGEA